jgi:hypothetical protein
MINTIDMAEKQFTLPELQGMTKPKLQELGESLNLQMKGLSKPVGPNVEKSYRWKVENDNETEMEEVKGEELSGVTIPPTQSQSAKYASMDKNMQFQLEMEKNSS